MSGKKLTILVLVVLGGATFAASYGLSRWFGVGPVPAAGGTEAGQAPPAADAPAGPGAFEEATRLEEKHLMDLIKDVREKLRDCDKRKETLDEEQRRLRLAHEDLRQEAQQLEALRVQVNTAVANVKEAKAELERTRTLINVDELANLKRTAGVYDAMDAEAASQIIESMCKNNQEIDAVKILRYMQPRTVAKVLAALTDKQLAASLCDRMKRLREQG